MGRLIKALDSGHLSIVAAPKPRAKQSKSFTPQIFRTEVDFYLHLVPLKRLSRESGA